MASVARKDAKRFSSLNLGTTYKGAKPEAKGAGNKGGFQSLGKIQGKRMPGPAQLPSLRKENAGNDPNINLVPQTGGGWGAGKEDEMELSSQPSSSQQPVTQAQDTHPTTQESTTAKETSVKKEGIWGTSEANSVGPANLPPPTQQFKKNFPSLEEREARGTKRTIGNEGHHDSAPVVPFTEMDNTSNVTATMPHGHYHYTHRPRAPYHAGPSHMAPPYLQRGMPPFRHGVPPPTGAEYNHYGHRGASFHGYPPQQQPGLPPNSATGGQYQYPMARFPLHPNSSLAHNMEPYHDGQSKLVKSEELKNLELPDEDDDVGGWAGYHEEVDYSKKVVFDDSGDDEERENHHERQPKRKEIHERESTNRETRMQEAPPLTTEQPHTPHAEQSSKHLHTLPADLQYFQQQHIPISGGHYPHYYHPQRGYPITVASRPVDKERPHPVPPQSDLQPIWQQNRRPKGVPPPESAWGEDKLVSSPTVSQPSTVQSIANEQLESLQQQLEHTTLSDNDSIATTATASAAISAEKKHVTFHIEQQQPAPPPATRQPMKIMMRDMKASTRDEHDSPPATDVFYHSNMGKPPYLQRPNDPDHQHVANTDKSLPQQQRVSPWKAADRGPITTPRTLYEPEGDKSAKKFNALIKQTSSERGKRSSVSDTAQDGGEQIQSPSGDIKILKAEEKQPKGKHQVTAATPTDDTANVHKSQQSSVGKSKTTDASSTTTKKGSKRERPGYRQYQPPPAREQDEQAYSEGKGNGRRQSRQDYNNEQQQGDGRGQRRRDRQQPEGKYHMEGKDRRYLPDSKHQTEGKSNSEGKTQSETKHHPEGNKRQHVDGNRRESRSRKEREASKEPPSQEQTEQLTATAADAFKEDVSKPEQSQDDKTKQSGKDLHSKGGNSSGETKHRKKTTSGAVAHKSDTSVPKEKSRSRGSRNRGSNNDEGWYYSEEYYNQWYGGGYDYYYDYHYDDYNYYPDQRRLPSGRQKQQPYDGSSKNTSERRDNGGKRPQQHSDRGSNRPARTRGGDRKDESSDDKAQQHRSTKDKSREVTSEEVPRSKPAEEADTRDKNRRRDNKQHVDGNVDKKRSSRTISGKGNPPQSTASTSKSSVSHDPTGRSRTSSGKTTSVTQDRPLQSDHSHTAVVSDNSSSKKEPTIKDKAASAKMANVDINSPTVFVIDEEQTVPLSSTVSENDDFIRVTSKKEKRELKEMEKHRQQEKQRKAEEEENKKKHHSTRKSSQKTKQQQQHQLQEQSLAQDDQSLSSWNTTPNTSAPTVTTASIWTESFTNLLNEGVNQTTYMAAAHSSLMPSGDYQLFPTSYSTPSVPLAHLSAAVDSSVVHDLPTTASQGHSLSETDVKPSGVGRPDTSSAGHGAIRTDLPLSKSHSSASVGGAIGRGRGSSSSRAPGSNRGSSSSKESKRLPASSSDSKVSATTSPKISKPSTAVRSKPSSATTTVTSSDKVTQPSVSPAMAATTATGGKKITTAQVTRATQDGGGSSSKRAGGHSVGSGHKKNIKHHSTKLSSTQRQQQSMQQQPHPVPAQPRPVSAQPCPVSAQPHAPSSSTTSNTISYAGAVKSSPTSQDKKRSTVSKPVAYVKPTASTVANLVDQQEDITAVVTSVERLASFPTAHLSQEILPEEDAVVLTSAVEQVKPVKVTSNEPAVPLATSYVSPVVTESPSPVTTTTASNRLSSFAPFTFVASPSPSSVVNHQTVITQVTTVTSTVTTQSGSSGKEEVEEVASKRRRLSPVPTTVQHSDHSTKLNIAADPFVPSSLPTAVSKPAMTTPTINMATPTAATTTSHKTSIPAACYLPAAPMMHHHSMVPIMMPHLQLGSGYAISQAAAYPSVFPAAVPSHAYQMPTHPPSIVGLPYAAARYPMQQPTMLPPPAVTNNNVHNAANYSMFVPVTAPAPPPLAAAAHLARVEQRKKEEQIKALNDTKRFFEQNGSSVAKKPPQLGYKYPTLAVKPQLPVATEGGRRTLLENPPAAMAMPHLPMGSMMNRPLEMTTVNTSPSTGSKRKRRPPLMPLPQIPTADNVTMVTPWDKPTTLY